MEFSDRGARFVRAALQVNPYDYIARTGGATTYETEEAYNAAMVEAMRDREISVIGITDHHSATQSAGLRAAAESAGITVLPGFEAHTKDGVHVLCLFDPSVDEAYVERFIGACGVGEKAAELGPGDKDCLELLALVSAWGGVAIAAHATNAKGLLRTLSGLPRARVWANDELLAAAIPGAVEDLPPEYRPIVENKDEAHRRIHPMAIVNAADVSDPAGFADASSWTWLKLTTPTIESVRQAFLDPASRVRLSSAADPASHNELTEIRWEGGFLNDVAIPFNEGLNVLIGGRGSGKSTVVESIRFVANLEPLGAEATKAHDGFVKSVLKPGTKVTLEVRSPSPSDRAYTVERSVGKAPIVRSADGQILEVAPLDVIPDLEVLGQHEIAELARLPEERARLLARFVPPDLDEEQRISEALAGLRSNARDVLKASADVSASTDALEVLPALEERMKRYDDVGLKDRLDAQSALTQEEALFDSGDEAVAGLVDALADFRERLAVDAESFAVDPEAPEDLRSVQTIFTNLNAALATHVDNIAAALSASADELESALAAWTARTQPIRDAYDGVLRELQAEGIDGSDYLATQRRVSRLKPAEQRHEKLEQRHDTLSARRRELLAELDDLRSAKFRRTEAAAKSVSRKMRPDLRIQVHYQGAREPLHEFLASKVGGRLDSVRRELDALPAVSLSDLATVCRSGADALSQEYGFTRKQADALAGADEAVLLELEELELPTTASIELNVASADADPVWRDLDELSTGQRATAVLMLLLHGGDSPLIVDQPEDDLDNAFISDGVVPRLREAKTARQFILTSHNPNIPVLADAELIAVLEATGEADGSGHASVVTIGSIDSDAVRSVVELLEGGQVAFDQRRRRYGF